MVPYVVLLLLMAVVLVVVDHYTVRLHAERHWYLPEQQLHHRKISAVLGEVRRV